MRLFFFLLVLINLVIFLVMQGARDRSSEPERLALQLNAERVTLLDAAGTPVTRPSAPAAPTPAANTPSSAGRATETKTLPAAGGANACVEIGDFNTDTAAKFEEQLSRLPHSGVPQRRIVRAAPSQLVYLPSQGSEADANRRLAQLRDLGFKDSAVIRDDSARRWGISLGRFTRTELADARLEKLRSAGVPDARIIEYPANSTRFAYRLSGMEAAGGARLAAAVSAFEGVTMRRCP